MTQGFDELKEITSAMNRSFKQGAASRQAEIDLLEKEIIETQQFLNNQNCIKQAEIDELQKRLAVYERQGYKLVPVEPIDEMIAAGENELWYRNGSAYSVYKAMIGAVE